MKSKIKKTISIILTLAIVAAMVPAFITLDFAGASVNVPRITVDMARKTGDLLQGASGFLYGLGANDVPSTNTLVPIKPKVTVQMAPDGWQHPNGDSLRVAEGFIESGGEQVQIYLQCYYGQWPYENVGHEDYMYLVSKMVPKIRDHAYSDYLVYIPYNEPDHIWYSGSSTATRTRFHNDWLDVYNLIHDLYKTRNTGTAEAPVWDYELNAQGEPIRPRIGGPNTAAYTRGNSATSIEALMRFAIVNDCVPDYMTWHTLQSRQAVLDTVAEYRAVEQALMRDFEPRLREIGFWPLELPVVINEYAEPFETSVPGELIRWLGVFEDTKVYACLPYWKLSGNLNDLAADSNNGNGAWWLYKWYGDLSGQSLHLRTSLAPQQYYGLAAIDDNKELSTVLFGGVSGASEIVLDNIDQAAPFYGAAKAHVTVTAAHWTGFHGVAFEPDMVLEGVFPIVNGALVVAMEDMISTSAYNLTVTPAAADAEVGVPVVGTWRGLFHASDTDKLGRTANRSRINNWYATLSGTVVTGFRGPSDGVIYNVVVPQDGRYRMDLIYGNGFGAMISDYTRHDPLMVEQLLIVNEVPMGAMELRNTLGAFMKGMHTEYVQLRAGMNEIQIMATNVPQGLAQDDVAHDGIYLTLEGAYGQPQPGFNRIYQSYLGDFNELGVPETPTAPLPPPKPTALTIARDIPGYTGSGYITGLNVNPVTAGGGVRFTVVVPDNGLYNVGLRYASGAAGSAGIYVGNTARTLERKVADTPIVDTQGQFRMSTQTVYLQRGINIIDIDATVDIAFDYMRVWEARDVGHHRILVEAESGRISGVNWMPTYDRHPSGAPSARPDHAVLTGFTNAGPAARVGNSRYASGGQYVTGVRADLSGTHLVPMMTYEHSPWDVPASNTAWHNRLIEEVTITEENYLEIDVTVPSAGLYKMAVYYSWGEIFSNHSYNAQVVDPFASISVNGGPSVKHDFQNTFSDETFMPKTIAVNLNEGLNTIRVYNDNQHILYWGDLRGRPTGWIVIAENYTPNLDRFEFFPAALAVPAQTDIDEFMINITTTANGIVVPDKDLVRQGENVTLTITPDVEIAGIIVDGVNVLQALTDLGNGSFAYTILNVQRDVNVRVWFESPLPDEPPPPSIFRNYSFEYGLEGWAVVADGALASVQSDFASEGDYALLIAASEGGTFTATVSQTLTGMPAGLYTLSYDIRNNSADGFNQSFTATFSDGSSESASVAASNNAFASRSIAFVNMIEGGAMDIAFAASTSQDGRTVILDNLRLEFRGFENIWIDPDNALNASYGRNNDVWPINNGIVTSVIGLTNETWSRADPPPNAFDGNASNFYDGQRYSYVGLSLARDFYITGVRFIYRAGFPERLNTNRIAGMTSANTPVSGNVTPSSQAVFNTNWVTIHTFSEGATGSWQEFAFPNQTTAFRHVRFASSGASGAACNPGEIEFFGRISTADVPDIVVNLPSSKLAAAGAPVTLTVEASGGGALSYQWYKDGAAIDGATAPAYTIENPTVEQSGEYFVIVTATAPAGTGERTASRLSQACDLVVTAEPMDATVPIFTRNLPESMMLSSGQPLTLTVAADANGVVTYQWYKDDTAIAGATGTTFSIESFTAEHAGAYKAVATNTLASAPNTQVASRSSNVTVVSIFGTPSVTGLPETLELSRGTEMHTFSVVAAGDGVLTYQWFRDNVPIQGANRRSFSIFDISPVIHDATYKVVVTSTIPGMAPITAEAETVVTVDRARSPDMVDASIAYFVDAGDHNPWTLSFGDKLGAFNSVTDQAYGADPDTGMSWGITMTKPTWTHTDTVLVPNPPAAPAGSLGVHTRYTWPFEQAGGNTDGVAKNFSLRYSKDQLNANWGGQPPFTGLGYNYISYDFELPAGDYIVEVYFVNTWNNAGSPQLWLDGAHVGTASVPSGNTAVGLIREHTVLAGGQNLAPAAAGPGAGNGNLNVEARSTTDGLQLAYIIIRPVAVAVPADYSAVDAAIAELEKLDRNTVKSGLEELDTAVAAVVWGLDESQQATVDGFATAIQVAFEALEYWPLVTTLRFNLNAITRVSRNGSIDLTDALSVNSDANLNPNPANVEFRVSNTAMAEISADQTRVNTMNRAGTVTLTAIYTEGETTLRTSVTLMIT